MKSIKQIIEQKKRIAEQINENILNYYGYNDRYVQNKKRSYFELIQFLCLCYTKNIINKNNYPIDSNKQYSKEYYKLTSEQIKQYKKRRKIIKEINNL